MENHTFQAWQPSEESSIAEIDLRAISHNLASIRQIAQGKAVCAVVKANAYGHGLTQIGRVLQEASIDWFAVATVSEGVALRNSGVCTPILVLRYSDPRHAPLLVEHMLTPVVYDISQLAMIASNAAGATLRFHLNIDTGMSRIGIRPYEVSTFLEHLRAFPALVLDGLMTHLANADLRDHAFNQRQLTRFVAVLAQLRDAGIEPRWVHVANSAATLTEEAAIFNMVRPGLALYGICPLQPPSNVELRPAMRWTTRAIQVRRIPPGTPVSYGGAWISKRESVVATLPVGYADGYRRSMTGAAQVLVRGIRVPIVGAICMDFCVADVTDVTGFSVDEEIVLLGSQGDGVLSAYELADWSKSIPYEVVCLVGDRVRRIYRSG